MREYIVSSLAGDPIQWHNIHGYTVEEERARPLFKLLLATSNQDAIIEFVKNIGFPLGSKLHPDIIYTSEDSIIMN